MNPADRAAVLEDLAGRVGREIGRSRWMKIDQDRIDAFAACTDDPQWIHVDPGKAARGPFGNTVAHGFLILSLITRLSREAAPFPELEGIILNYGLNRARFLRPVPVGAEIRDTLLLKEVSDKGEGKILLTIQHTIHIRGQSEPACVAEVLRMILTAPPGDA